MLQLPKELFIDEIFKYLSYDTHFNLMTTTSNMYQPALFLELYSTDIKTMLIQTGNLSALKSFYTISPDDLNDFPALQIAAEYGQVEVFLWIVNKSITPYNMKEVDRIYEAIELNESYTSTNTASIEYVANVAATNGHLYILRWIYANHEISTITFCFRNWVTNLAAANGHIHILTYLTSIAVFDIDEYMGIDLIVGANQLDALKFLHSNIHLFEVDDERIQSIARARGHTKLLAWLRENWFSI